MFVASEHAWRVLARVVVEGGEGLTIGCCIDAVPVLDGLLGWGMLAGGWELGGGTHCRLKRLVEGMSPLLVASEGVVELCVCVVGEHDDQIR